MITFEVYTAGGEILTGTFTLPVSGAYAILYTMTGGTACIMVNGADAELNRKTLTSLKAGDKVEVFV
jgi:hypothetical protein